MEDFTFKVNLVVVVRVRAGDESVALSLHKSPAPAWSVNASASRT